MSIDDIKILVKAFYAGNTTPEQENILFTYFSGDNVAEELYAEKEYFLEMYKLEKAAVPADFQSRIDTLFKDIERQEALRFRIKRSLMWGGSIAATIAVFLFFLMSNHNVNHQPALVLSKMYSQNEFKIKKPDTTYSQKVDTIRLEDVSVKKKSVGKIRKSPVVDDSDYLKIKEALELVAININEGLVQLDSVSANLALTTEIIENNKYK